MVADTVKFATRDGVKLAYVEAGSGDPAIVFVHGWTCNFSHWRHQVPEFANKHRVVALDLRGHGQSEKPEQDYGIGEFADDVAWMIGELGLERPVVVGHSMGGVIAANIARRHPGSTRGVVLVDSPVAPLGPQLKPVADGLLASLQTPGYRQLAEGFLRQFMFNEGSDSALIEEIAESSLRTPQRVMHTALASTFKENESVRGALPVPSLFIRAATQYAPADQIRDLLPGIEITEVDCAHFVQLEKPEETNRLIRQFVEDLPK
jgi:pimeloyl-ACP methyl ester carboxylesterase